MKHDITLSLDADLLRQVEILARRKGTSISALVAGELEKLVCEDSAYEAARRRAMRRLEQGYDLGWTPEPSRDAAHER